MIIGIFIPTKDKFGFDLSGEATAFWTKRLKQWLSESFGGYTLQFGVGGWYNKVDDKFIEEAVQILWAFAEPTEEQWVTFQYLAEEMKQELNQDSVLIVKGDTPNFV